MSMYMDEWPLLILCPSSARYHWASECRKWLGHAINNMTTANADFHSQADPLLSDNQNNMDTNKLIETDQVHVLMSSKDHILPQQNTRIVVCSYGLAPTLISSGKIHPGLFKCAVVDESHMLKNKSAKRTQTLIPVLRATTRCVLLSGTPALARPAELWPQLEIIGTEEQGWWEDEQEFVDRYVKNASAQRRAELHTLLTGTVMIRRLKPDILKTLPNKIREKASVKLLDGQGRKEFKELILQLKESKGALGMLARKDDTFSSDGSEPAPDQSTAASGGKQVVGNNQASHSTSSRESPENARAAAEHALRESIRVQRERSRAQNHEYLRSLSYQLSPLQLDSLKTQLETELHSQMERVYKEGLAVICSTYGEAANGEAEEDNANNRKTLLSRLYGLTGDVKVPLMVDLLDRWYKDPTKGKVCIFAHHLSVLDSIEKGAGLSNDSSSRRKFIRIDGSTSPKVRQQQIDDFQSDPSVRVALLGITAAGVAVTLTASSTVWFAELFWTPALMIQAEDRAHRIGQASQVKCLYIVAKGTLDE